MSENIIKAQLNYVKGHPTSEKCLKVLIESLEKHGWEYEAVPGITPDTVGEYDNYKNLPVGRLESFYLEKSAQESKKYPIKRSCALNHVRFAKSIVEQNKPMIFLEHDVVAIAPPPSDEGVADYLFLNMQHAFDPPSELANCVAGRNCGRWMKRTKHKPINSLRLPGSEYYLQYYKKSVYFGALMSPGTSAYLMTVAGAKKLIKAVEVNGLEQSDFMLNSKVVHMQYNYPSPVKFQKENPNLSHGL